MSRAGIKGYNILLRGDVKNPVDDTDKTNYKGVNSTLKPLYKRAYNELILPQEDMVCLHFLEEVKTKANKHEDARQV